MMELNLDAGTREEIVRRAQEMARLKAAPMTPHERYCAVVAHDALERARDALIESGIDLPSWLWDLPEDLDAASGYLVFRLPPGMTAKPGEGRTTDGAGPEPREQRP